MVASPEFLGITMRDFIFIFRVLEKKIDFLNWTIIGFLLVVIRPLTMFLI